MEKELRDAFGEIKTLITNESASRRRSFEAFKIQHDEIAKPYTDKVKEHDIVLKGKDAKGGLIACVQRIKEKVSMNRQLIWFCFVTIIGTVVLLFRNEILKILGGVL